MKKAKYTFLIGAGALLVACNSHENVYKTQSQQTPPLVMPANVTLKNVEPYYPIPQQINTKVAQPSLIPPNSALAKQDTKKVKS